MLIVDILNLFHVRFEEIHRVKEKDFDTKSIFLFS